MDIHEAALVVGVVAFLGLLIAAVHVEYKKIAILEANGCVTHMTVE